MTWFAEPPGLSDRTPEPPGTITELLTPFLGPKIASNPHHPALAVTVPVFSITSSHELFRTLQETDVNWTGDGGAGQPGQPDKLKTKPATARALTDRTTIAAATIARFLFRWRDLAGLVSGGRANPSHCMSKQEIRFSDFESVFLSERMASD